MTTAKEIIEYMESLLDDGQRKVLMGFFKTAPGEYGYGDEFLGLKVPQTRKIVKEAKDTPLCEIPELLMSKWHEVRLCGLLILVNRFERLATKRLVNDATATQERDQILSLYLKYAEQASNWDLVDLSAPKILGHWLLLPTNLGDGTDDYKRQVLDKLAQSKNLWRQRMSIVCTWKTSQQGDPSWCLRYAEIHLHHPHDLMHKAVGWMLREMGKRISMDLLREFLRQHVHEMPRTTLRYAIEKMTEAERKQWMAMPTEEYFKPLGHVSASPFAGIPLPEFVDIILCRHEKADEAMYNLLHNRLNHRLRERYADYEHHLADAFEDIVEDFFLYLREGQDGKNRSPYQSLQHINKKESFEAWMLNTFRNYLSNRSQTENRINAACQKSQPTTAQAADPSDLTDERKLCIASQLIAYAHQVFYPRGRFILLRTLLSMLNRQKAMPDKDIAEVLDMTYLAYRVMVHRIKGNLTGFRLRLLQGEELRLDSQHQQMARQIYKDFTHLYPTLVIYYNESIESLKCRDAIKMLRQQYNDATGDMLHEPSPADAPINITPAALWNKLNHLLLI